MYYRTYLIQDGITHLFGLSQRSISTNIGKIAPTIWEFLPVPQDIDGQTKKCSTVEELNGFFPGLVALTDASEQPIQKPRRSDMESHYAKANTHTVKVQYTTSFDGLIVHKTTHSPGRRHDFKVYKMKHPTFPDSLSCGNEENSGSSAATTCDTIATRHTSQWTRPFRGWTIPRRSSAGRTRT